MHSICTAFCDTLVLDCIHSFFSHQTLPIRFLFNLIGGVIVSVLGSSAEDCVPARNQDNVSEGGDMGIRGLLFQ